MKQTVSRLLLVTAMFILCLPLAMAQAKWTVSGTVTDQNNEPLIGVSITSGKDAARIGATTDIDGKYTIVVPAGATINFAYVGYVPQDLKAVNGTLDVVLQEDNKTLDEVVVVGYGVQKKSSVTGAISQVKAEDIQNRTVVNPQSALQGKTAGVQIVSASNAPGSSPTVRVRGYSSNVSSDPLYVVDGVRLSDISGLDPNDIASIEVLKDAASAAIYGAEAGNGVVLISTKRGKAGQGKITYDFQYTSERVAKVPKMLNAEQYIEYMAEANTFTLDQMLLNWDGVTNTSWIDETFETGHMQRHNLSFTNGNERGNYYLSLSYMDNNGIIGGDADRYSRLTAAINAEYDIKDWLKVGTTNQIEKWNSRQVSSNNEYGSVLTSVLMLDPLTPFKYSPDNLPSHMVQALNSGKELLTDKDGNYYSVSRWQSAESYHPFTMRDNTVARQSGFNVNGSIFGEFKPVKGLVVTSRLGYRLSASRSSSVDLPFYGNATQSRDFLGLTASNSSTIYYQWENFANYFKTFGENTEDFLTAFEKAFPGYQPIDLIDTDFTFRPGAVEQGNIKSAVEGAAPVYMYMFAWESPVMDGRLRSTHCMEIPFVFNNTDRHASMTGGGEDARKLGKIMSEAWLNFARTGKPAAEGMPEWPAYTAENGATMWFDNNCHVTNHHDKELLDIVHRAPVRGF